MFLMQMTEEAHKYAPDAIALKMALSVGLGLLVGFEREWSNKDIGVRSFALASLLGMLSGLISLSFALAALASALIIVIFVNWGSFHSEKRLEITTSIALVITVILGILVGQGHHFTPVASAIVMTMLLAWKQELHRFAGGLRPEEIRSAVLLGLLGFVIYPILPNEFIDRWQLVNPRQAWITIVVVALVGFANYVLLRIYSTRGLYYTAVLGGLVNSTATVSELALAVGNRSGLNGMTVGLILLTTVAMFARNLLILALFSPSALASAAVPIVAMAAMAAVFIVRSRSAAAEFTREELQLGSPVSLRRVFTFGVLFLAIGAAGTLAQAFLGQSGFLMVSAIGGFVSSASTTAAAANMAHSGKITAASAGTAAVITSVTSALINLPIVFRLVEDKAVRNRLAATSLLVIVAGLLAAWFVNLR